MAKDYDREASKAAQAERIANARSALRTGLEGLQTDDDWQRMLRVSAQLGALSPRRYSFHNQILLVVQRADLTGVATFQTWKDHGRSVKKGAKARYILRPVPYKRERTERQDDGTETAVSVNGVSFRPLAVFDVGQTEGDALEPPALPRIDAPEAFARSVEQLSAVALGLEGSPVSAVRFVAHDPNSRAHGWYCRSTREIVVCTEGRTRAEQFKTLVHEVAHSILHGADNHHALPVCEVEAESVAFVVCHALGLDSGAYSFPYVATWASRAEGEKDPLAVVAQTGERINKASNKILDALVGTTLAELSQAA